MQGYGLVSSRYVSGSSQSKAELGGGTDLASYIGM